MKSSLILAFALASITAFAQTESAPAAATEQTAPAAKTASKVKKVKKSAKKKAAAKPSAAIDVAPAAAIQAGSSVAPATTVAANEGISSAPTATAGTSTATAAAPAADAKKWSVSFVSEIDATNDLVTKAMADNSFDTINLVGAGYKVTADTKVGLRQYFNYKMEPNQTSKGINQWTVATVGTKVKGIAGSDEISPLFWYYMPTENALKNVYNTESGAIENHNGILRMDAEVVWTLNPKWQVSYYFNPRQSLVKRQSYTDLDGKAQNIEATTTLIHYGILYYNFNDNFQTYGYMGMDNRMTTTNARSIKDHALLAIGASYSAFAGKLVVNPEIGNEVPLKDNGEYASAPRWLQSDDIKYQLTTALTF